MKILGTIGEWGGCSWYRIAAPLIALHKKLGIEIDFVIDKLRFDGDAIVFPRVSSKEGITFMRQAKAMGKRVIVDFDDCFHEIPPWSMCHEPFQHTDALPIFDKACVEADVLSCSTQPLADYYREKTGRELAVCHNFAWSEHVEAVAPKEITGKPKREGEIRIGYVGSYTHLLDIACIKDVLVEICAKYPQVKLVSMGQPFVLPAGFDKHRVEHHVGTWFDPQKDGYLAQFMYRYYREIGELDLDIGLAPLEPSIFNSCKSNIRFFEYGMNGVPVVASAYGAYASWPTMIASTHSEWFMAISAMINNEENRRNMASVGLEHLREKWTDATILPQWEAAWLGEKTVTLPAGNYDDAQSRAILEEAIG
jgi:hypothetical protein